jgi:hypothetical protein
MTAHTVPYVSYPPVIRLLCLVRAYLVPQKPLYTCMVYARAVLLIFSLSILPYYLSTNYLQLVLLVQHITIHTVLQIERE